MARTCSSCPNKKTYFTPVTHVIFDLDGLLLDTEKVYMHASTNIIKQFDKTLDWSIKGKILGIPGPAKARIIVRELNLPMTWAEYYAQVQEEYIQILTPARLMPGAERLIQHLFDNEIPIAIATSSSAETYEIKSANCRSLFSLFHHIVAGGSDPEVKRGKPNPDIFLICASRFDEKPDPEDCLVFEDSPKGVTAAIDAGMQCIMVPDRHLHPELTKQATQVLKTLEYVQPEQFGLPFLKSIFKIKYNV